MTPTASRGTHRPNHCPGQPSAPSPQLPGQGRVPADQPEEAREQRGPPGRPGQPPSCPTRSSAQPDRTAHATRHSPSPGVGGSHAETRTGTEAAGPPSWRTPSRRAPRLLSATGQRTQEPGGTRVGPPPPRLLTPRSRARRQPPPPRRTRTRRGEAHRHGGGAGESNTGRKTPAGRHNGTITAPRLRPPRAAPARSQSPRSAEAEDPMADGEGRSPLCPSQP